MYCDDCDLSFNSWPALQQHWVQSPAHSYCQQCDEHFYDKANLEDHYDLEHIWCSSCRRFFKNVHGLEEHYRQSPYHRQSSYQHYCAPCGLSFESESNLRSHLNSKVHKPKNFQCQGCDLAFVSLSALTLHMEAGTCRSGMNRDKVNRLIRQNDRNHFITDPSRMITAGGSGKTTKLYATEAAWNGYGYECYLCHRTFRTLSVLNGHLASPRHQEKMYICPLSTCRARFSALSGLCQHIESERCGVLKFQVVQDTVDQLVGRLKRLTY